MDYDREEGRRRREYEQARAAQAKLEEKLAALKRSARAAKLRLLSTTTKSETWHRMSLGWLDREAGYAGEMAAARVWLRSQPLQTYMTIMVDIARGMAEGTKAATNVEIEVAAVNANLVDWTARGEAMLLDRAKRDYAADAASFAAWRHDHPDHDSWRRKPPTRAQRFLVTRMAAALEIEPPSRMTRGEAHDWIADHGGNPRLANNPVPASPVTPTEGDGGAALTLPFGGKTVL